MPTIFISHAHEDWVIARDLKNLLEDLLHDHGAVFCSSQDLRPGELWVPRIFDELKAAQAVLTVLSSSALQQPWLAFETGAAWALSKLIIPICVTSVVLETLPHPYSDFQAINLSLPSAPTGLRSLCAVLRGQGFGLNNVLDGRSFTPMENALLGSLGDEYERALRRERAVKRQRRSQR